MHQCQLVWPAAAAAAAVSMQSAHQLSAVVMNFQSSAVHCY